MEDLFIFIFITLFAIIPILLLKRSSNVVSKIIAIIYLLIIPIGYYILFDLKSFGNLVSLLILILTLIFFSTITSLLSSIKIKKRNWIYGVLFLVVELFSFFSLINSSTNVSVILVFYIMALISIILSISIFLFVKSKKNNTCLWELLFHFSIYIYIFLFFYYDF